jgi:hypothetical protein
MNADPLREITQADVRGYDEDGVVRVGFPINMPVASALEGPLGVDAPLDLMRIYQYIDAYPALAEEV